MAKRRREEEITFEELNRQINNIVGYNTDSKDIIKLLDITHKYILDTRQLQLLSGALKSFSNITYEDVSTYFDLPVDYNDIDEYNITQAKLPKQIYEKIINDLNETENTFRPIGISRIEDQRKKFIDVIIKNIITYWHGDIASDTELKLNAPKSHGEVEYVIRAFQIICIMILEAKVNVDTAKNVAQALIELYAADYENLINQYRINPITGALSNAEKWYFFEYNGITNTFKMSKEYKLSKKDIKSTIILINIIYSMMLDAWIKINNIIKETYEINKDLVINIFGKKYIEDEKTLEIKLDKRLKLSIEAREIAINSKNNEDAENALNKLKESIKLIPDKFQNNSLWKLDLTDNEIYNIN